MELKDIIESKGSFNKDLTLQDYQNTKPFLNGVSGLVDTIHRKYPELRDTFKKLKSLDWSEDEFRFEKCNADFKDAYNSDKVSQDMADLMIETIMWQWEADSNVSQTPIAIISMIQPIFEIFELESEISKNEIVHANTYSEIVRLSFDNPHDVMNKVLSAQEPLKRLEIVEKTLGTVYKEFLNRQYCIVNNLPVKEDSYYIKLIITMYFTIYCLERIQFMASFAITFTICTLAKAYQPIGEAVQKICQDEFETHCVGRKYILLDILKKQYPKEFEECKPLMNDIFKAIVDSEKNWTESLFENRSIVGIDCETLTQWILFNAADVHYSVGLENDYIFPDKNPMPSLNTWLSMNLLQNANQEGDSTAYKVGIVDKSSMGKVGFNKFD